MSDASNETKPKPSKKLRILLTIVLALATLGILFLSSVYILLHTKILENNLIPIVLEKLEKQSGIKATVGDSEITILSALSLRDISVELPDMEGINGKADIKSIDITFSIKKLWKGEFFVKSVEINNPRVNLEITLSELQKEKEKEQKSLAETIDGFLVTLPFPKIRTILYVHDAEISVKENDNQASIDIFEEDMELETELDMNLNSLRLEAKTSLGGEKSFIKAAYGDYRASLGYEFSVNLEGDAVDEGSSYVLDFPAVNLEFSLRDVSVFSKSRNYVSLPKLMGDISCIVNNKEITVKNVRQTKDNRETDGFDILSEAFAEESKKKISNELSLSGNIFAQEYNVLSFSGTIADNPGKLSGKISSVMRYSDALYEHIKEIPMSELIDSVSLNETVRFVIPHDSNTVLDVKDIMGLKDRAVVDLDASIFAGLNKTEAIFELPVRDIPLRITDWKASLSAKMDIPKKSIDLAVSFENGKKDLEFFVKGFSSFDLNTAIFDGNFKFKPFFPKDKKRYASGSFSVPFKVNSLGKKSFDLSGSLKFDKFSLANSIVEAKAIEGKVPIREKIKIIDDKRIAFMYVYDENPFNRADYVLIKPYVSSSDSFTLSVENISKGEISVGQLLVDLHLEQNMIKAEHLRMKIFEGDLEGKFFMNVLRNSEEVGIIGIFSQLDPNKIINIEKEKKSAGRISGQIESIYNINSSTVEGRVDINEIGKAQLLALADALDPLRQDSKMNTLRGVLKLAYPTYVGVVMERGFFDLTVKVPSLALIKGSGKLSFRGLPLTPIVAIYSRYVKQILDLSPFELNLLNKNYN